MDTRQVVATGDPVQLIPGASDEFTDEVTPDVAGNKLRDNAFERKGVGSWDLDAIGLEDDDFDTLDLEAILSDVADDITAVWSDAESAEAQWRYRTRLQGGWR